ncbi:MULTISPECIES: hypothetical protein [unclassified Microbacterium]|uniref:hypothetical protein n=1 Tax=unclassified Microbacterium TaxID=2609290 RepID=UPI0012F8006A|nr:hypothetical protein [Microbacterium sp. MAH-37]MVQ43797.1 hypothetical protein [Microbacterium sp. MAH-37]
MRHRISLPRELGAHFSVSEAAAHGVGRGRRDAADLARPFHGIRSQVVPESFSVRVACYLPRLRPGQRLAARTALRLWGMPFPQRWQPDEPVDVTVLPTSTPPRARGTAGHRLAAGRAETWRVDGAPVIDPIAALFQCAPGLTILQAVILIDALITEADNYPGLRPGRPGTTPAQIEARLDAWGRFPGCATIRRALAFVRAGVESPKETETRWLIVSAGLPEPVLQHEVRDRGVLIARVDLAYPELRIAVEYEGDGHRTSQTQWRRDIRRQRDLEDRGWIVIRLTQHDLSPASSFIPRLRRALASRR